MNPSRTIAPSIRSIVASTMYWEDGDLFCVIGEIQNARICWTRNTMYIKDFEWAHSADFVISDEPIDFENDQDVTRCACVLYDDMWGPTVLYVFLTPGSDKRDMLLAELNALKAIDDGEYGICVIIIKTTEEQIMEYAPKVALHGENRFDNELDKAAVMSAVKHVHTREIPGLQEWLESEEQNTIFLESSLE